MSAETVADVVAWMRGYAAGFNLYLRTGMTFRDWFLLCDRLEAAHKRGIDALKSPAAPAPSGAIGDPAKLRGALEAIIEICDDKRVVSTREERMVVYNIAKAALAEPVRNCDVGARRRNSRDDEPAKKLLGLLVDAFRRGRYAVVFDLVAQAEDFLEHTSKTFQPNPESEAKNGHA